LRKVLHAHGKRFRVHYPLPGLPRQRADIAFPRLRVAVFVDGCFWHSCPDHATHPANNAEWWAAKLRRNRDRDAITTAHLQALGWRVVRVWEHVPPALAADLVEAELAAAGAVD
jgi:DNA mismatch endonuclease (patch repair protein)